MKTQEKIDLLAACVEHISAARAGTLRDSMAYKEMTAQMDALNDWADVLVQKQETKAALKKSGVPFTQDEVERLIKLKTGTLFGKAGQIPEATDPGSAKEKTDRGLLFEKLAEQMRQRELLSNERRPIMSVSALIPRLVDMEILVLRHDEVLIQISEELEDAVDDLHKVIDRVTGNYSKLLGRVRKLEDYVAEQKEDD